jgi:hypothetical protein
MYLEDIHPGDELVSEPRAITARDIDAFVELTATTTRSTSTRPRSVRLPPTTRRSRTACW